MMRISILLLAMMLFPGFLSNAGGQTKTAFPASVSGKGVKSASSKTESAEPSKSASADSTERKSPGETDESAAEADPLNYTRPVYTYSPEGRRDPFESLVPEVNKDEKKIKGLFNYEKGALRGIVRSEGGVYAMVVDGDNYAYVLRENDPVFGGSVSKITDDAVDLHIVKYGRAMTIVLRMDTAKKTLLAREDDESVVRRPGITVAWGAEQESGAVMAVEDVAVPSLETKTIEEVWFGKSSGNTDRSSPYLLLSPPENSEIRLPIVLKWTKSPQDSLFTLVIARDREFRKPLLVKEGIGDSTFLLDSIPARESGEQLFWKVIALHRSGEQFNSRNVLSFRIK